MKTRRFIMIMLLLAGFCVFAQTGNKEKPIITVLNFSMNGVSEHEMKALISLLSSALFQTGKYTVIDVSERDRLLKEMEFSAGDCSDESCQLQMGRMLSAESIVVGNITKVGTRYVLSAKILETETARTQNTSDGIYPSLDAMLDDIFNLANKLAKVSGSTTTTDTTTKTADAKTDKKTPDTQKTTKVTKKEETKADTTKTKEDKAKAAKTGAETDTKAKKTYLSLGVGAGVSLPLGPYQDLFRPGIPLSVDAALNFKLRWGVIGLLLNTGFVFQGTKDETEVRFPYNLLMVPLSVGLSYSTPTKPFYFTAKVAGGSILYVCLYREEFLNRDTGLYFSPYAAVGLGAGFQLSATWDLGVTANASLIFFEGEPNLNVGLQAFVNLKF